MKLLFASDIHGSLKAAQQLIERFKEEKADYLVLLGDLMYHGPRNPLPEGHDPQGVATLLNQYCHQIISVRGNCDAEVDQMLLQFRCLADEAWILADGYRFYLTHGHLNTVEDCALGQNDIYVHGHFHIPVLERRGDVIVMNPNSVALPKEGIAGYAIYENHELSLRSLTDGSQIATLQLTGDRTC